MNESNYGRWIVTIVLTLSLLGLIVWGGYEASWWLKEENQERNYQVQTQGQSYQAGLIAQLRNQVTDLNRLEEGTPQYEAIRSQFCTQYMTLTQEPEDLQAAFEQFNCEEIIS